MIMNPVSSNDLKFSEDAKYVLQNPFDPKRFETDEDYKKMYTGILKDTTFYKDVKEMDAGLSRHKN